MDFLPKTANLQGGDTHKAPKNTQFSKSRHDPEGKGHHGIPFQSFLTKIPIGTYERECSLIKVRQVD